MAPQTMAIAAIVYPPATDIDAMLTAAAGHLRDAGRRVGGVVQTRLPQEGCAMAVVDLASGAIRPIAQNLGPLSTACKLDTAALADVAAALEAQIDTGLDLLVLSRFGKLEIDGHGLRSVVERAVLAGTPVLVAVRDSNRHAWTAFHGGLGATLPPQADAINAWTEAATRRRPGMPPAG